MARKPRMYLPGVPAHVVQRGNNRAACFFTGADYGYYLECLSQGMKRYGVVLHAYCLMTNHVHLLMTPRSETSISRTLQHVGRLYVAYVNRRYRRSGTLWEGRHKASLIDAERYLLTCYRYIELNPVRAGMVSSPDAYPWSSYRWHAWGNPDSYIVDHDSYLGLGSLPSIRRRAYRDLFADYLQDVDLHQIRKCLAYNHPLGDEGFREQIEAALGRKVGEKQPGRPRKRTA